MKPRAARCVSPATFNARGSFAIFRRSAILVACCLALAGASLPETGPVPVKRPEKTAREQPAETPAGTDDRESEKAADQPEKPDESDQSGKKTPEGKEAESQEPEKTESEKSQALKEDPQALKACLAALEAAGATFKPIDKVADGAKCGMDHPIELAAVLPGVALEPPAQIRCETALALNRWTSAAVIPALKAARPDEKLTALRQASGYVCRNRNGASKGRISEHALGNAIDIASFAFKSGKTLAIAPRERDSTLDGAFQRAIAAAACLYFTTVLDPGSDAAHETHLHLDVKARRGGYRYCW